MYLIVDSQITEINNKLAKSGVEIILTKAARNWLAEKGYSKAMGARPLGRLISEKVKNPLSKEILFGQLNGGGRARIDIKNDEVIINAIKEQKKEKQSEPA